MIFSRKIMIGFTLVALVASAKAAPAYASQAIAEIEGQIEPELHELILQVFGEIDSPARSLAQARRRAETTAEQAKSVLRSQGYYGAIINARVDEFTAKLEGEEQRAPQPVLNIIPGPQFRFSTIEIDFEGKTPDVASRVSEIIALKPGQAAVAEIVVAAELRAINLLKATGYPDAKALPRKAIVDHDTAEMRVTYNLFAGGKTIFGDIEQTGTAKLVKSWPSMVAPFKAGDIFDDRKMNRLAARVIGTGVFDGATATLSGDSYSNGDGTVTRNVLLNVEQGSLNTIGGEVGYSTSDGSGVELVYERRNFVGYAQTLRLLGTVKTNEISAVAAYNIPYAWRSDRELDLGLTVARQNTDAFTGERVGSSILMTQKFPPKLKVSAGLSLEASRFKEDGFDVNAYLVEGLLKANYDTRDSLFDPVKGVNIEADITPSYNFGGSEGYFTNAEIGASTYRRVSPKIVAAGRAKLGTIFGAEQSAVPLNRRYYGGGGGSVRGYGFQSISPRNAENDPVGGRSIAEASAELRYRRQGSNLGFVGFVDAGSVTRQDLPTGDDIRYGAGVGLRYYTSFAPLRADVAVPLKKREGDNSVQIYLSIGQAF